MRLSATRTKRMLFAVFVLLLAAGPGLPAADTESDAAWLKDLQGYRTGRQAHISAPDGWLATVGLDWLKPGPNSFGTRPGNSIALQGGAGAAHLGVLVVQGEQVVLAAPEGGFPAVLQEDGGQPKAGPLRVDENATKLTAGPLSLIVIKRGGRFALRVRDSSAPARLAFKGLHWYDPDRSYIVEARWQPYVPPHTLVIPTEIGVPDRMPSPGVAEFKIKARVVRLEPVLESPDAKQLFFILRDATSGGGQSYGAGRFLYTGLPDHGLDKPGHLTLDFNRLENPACAYTAYATCPLPPRQNRFGVALPVGEKKYHP